MSCNGTKTGENHVHVGGVGPVRRPTRKSLVTFLPQQTGGNTWYTDKWPRARTFRARKTLSPSLSPSPSPSPSLEKGPRNNPRTLPRSGTRNGPPADSGWGCRRCRCLCLGRPRGRRVVQNLKGRRPGQRQMARHHQMAPTRVIGQLIDEACVGFRVYALQTK